MPDREHAPSQTDKFRDLARDLECDEDEKAFEKTVRKVAKPHTPSALGDQRENNQK